MRKYVHGSCTVELAAHVDFGWAVSEAEVYKAFAAVEQTQKAEFPKFFQGRAEG